MSVKINPIDLRSFEQRMEDRVERQIKLAEENNAAMWRLVDALEELNKSYLRVNPRGQRSTR